LARNSDIFSDRPFVICEIGVNHENDIDLAKKMIAEIAESGGDAAKFQTYKAGKLAIHDSPSYWDLESEPCRNQFELFSKFDHFEDSDYLELSDFSKSVGVEFMSTCFDIESLDFIDPLVRIHKIASADITNIPLLRAVGSKEKPVCISTGASTMQEIRRAVEELESSGSSKIALLHCVLNYPTSDENAQLGRIKDLSEEFPDYTIGYSDHTVPDSECLACLSAFLMGAMVIEKHFTHDRTISGNDHYHSMDKNTLRSLTSRLKQIESMSHYQGEENFLQSQQSAIINARRSIVTSRAVKAGEKLNSTNLTTKRPGNGLSAVNWDEVVGKIALIDMESDFQIKLEDFQ